MEMPEGGNPAAAAPDIGERYDVVIIGAGIGGLACGALLAREGMKVLIAERHARVGGFVADYERKGYRFQYLPQPVANPDQIRATITARTGRFEVDGALRSKVEVKGEAAETVSIDEPMRR